MTPRYMLHSAESKMIRKTKIENVLESVTKGGLIDEKIEGRKYRDTVPLSRPHMLCENNKLIYLAITISPVTFIYK
jgi:hypothetical protein